MLTGWRDPHSVEFGRSRHRALVSVAGLAWQETTHRHDQPIDSFELSGPLVGNFTRASRRFDARVASTGALGSHPAHADDKLSAALDVH